MVNAEGRPVIIDLGSSLVLKSGVIYDPPGCPGNARWMAPEALRRGGYPITTKLDVWSFGCLGIEVNTRARPKFLGAYANPRSRYFPERGLSTISSRIVPS